VIEVAGNHKVPQIVSSLADLYSDFRRIGHHVHDQPNHAFVHDLSLLNLVADPLDDDLSCHVRVLVLDHFPLHVHSHGLVSDDYCDRQSCQIPQQYQGIGAGREGPALLKS